MTAAEIAAEWKRLQPKLVKVCARITTLKRRRDTILHRMELLELMHATAAEREKAGK